MNDKIKFHICTEVPCPVQDKELYELLMSGFKTNYSEA